MEENEKTQITEEMAGKIYEEYMEAGLRMFPPFKGFGLKLIQFSMDEPELFRKLFLEKRDLSYQEYLEQRVEWDRVIPSICTSLELNEKEARWLFKNMLFYVLGMAGMVVSSDCFMTEQEISQNLGRLCRGLLMQLKAPEDERTRMIPGEEQRVSGELESYLKGKRKVIIGYGPEKEMYQVRLDAILYFEAVGENVFAYTKGNVYEIKQRLYRIEEKVKELSFERASKSLLVNLKKISSVATESGGRARILLINQETVIASRSYSRKIIEAMKGAMED